MAVTTHRGIRPLALLILLLVVGLPSAAIAALPLWELTHTSNRISLLGSIHFLRATDYPLNPAITAAFDEADVVLMEIDMDDLDPEASSRTIAALAVDGRGRKLPELLGPDAWRAATAEARELGLDLTPLAPFEPWYAAIVVTQQRLAQLGFDPSFGVETRMNGRCRATRQGDTRARNPGKPACHAGYPVAAGATRLPPEHAGGSRRSCRDCRRHDRCLEER